MARKNVSENKKFYQIHGVFDWKTVANGCEVQLFAEELVELAIVLGPKRAFESQGLGVEALDLVAGPGPRVKQGHPRMLACQSNLAIKTEGFGSSPSRFVQNNHSRTIFTITSGQPIQLSHRRCQQHARSICGTRTEVARQSRNLSATCAE